MVGKHAVDAQRVLADRQQAVFLRRDGDTGAGVSVYHARDFGPRLMHGAVDDESGVINAEACRIVDDVAVLIDLHQA